MASYQRGADESLDSAPGGAEPSKGSGAPLVSPGATLRKARERLGLTRGVIALSAALLIGGFALGMIVSTDWKNLQAGQAGAQFPVARESGREMVASTIRRLEKEQADLKGRISDLRSQITTLQQDDARRKTTLQDIHTDLDKQRIASGMVPLQGPGVVASFDDSSVGTVPQNEDPANYILHEYDLRDIVNALWIAGAEGMSLNGERIVGTTSIYCVGTTVIANATRLSPPYVVSAIGDPQALESSLRYSPQMAKFNERSQIYDLPVKIEQSRQVDLPAYNGSFVFKYATVEGEK